MAKKIDPKKIAKELAGLDRRFRGRMAELHKKYQAEIRDLLKDVDQNRIKELRRTLTKKDE